MFKQVLKCIFLYNSKWIRMHFYQICRLKMWHFKYYDFSLNYIHVLHIAVFYYKWQNSSTQNVFEILYHVTLCILQQYKLYLLQQWCKLNYVFYWRTSPSFSILKAFGFSNLIDARYSYTCYNILPLYFAR